ncbi:MAG: hypothetical protein V2I33_05530 [Kangiellaceae bacterium]|jgi:hypothetical protein|nr:hypothetical protein [Kangiellaceae bacterium]
MKRILLLTLALFSMAQYAEQTQKQRELSRMLSEAVAGLEKSLPMTLDEETRLDKVSTVKSFFVYNNTLTSYAASELDADKLDEILKTSVIGKLCSNKDLKGFIDNDVIMVYRYFGKDGKFVTELSKDMSTCK